MSPLWDEWEPAGIDYAPTWPPNEYLWRVLGWYGVLGGGLIMGQREYDAYANGMWESGGQVIV